MKLKCFKAYSIPLSLAFLVTNETLSSSEAGDAFPIAILLGTARSIGRSLLLSPRAKASDISRL